MQLQILNTGGPSSATFKNNGGLRPNKTIENQDQFFINNVKTKNFFKLDNKYSDSNNAGTQCSTATGILTNNSTATSQHLAKKDNSTKSNSDFKNFPNSNMHNKKR